MALSRRRFLSLSAGTLAAAAAAKLAFTRSASAARPTIDPGTDGRIVSSICEVCFWKCGIDAHVQGDRLIKITGNPRHPLSNGRLCPRGAAGVGLGYDPDRLVKPLMRVGARGRDEFRPVSWDEALGFVANKLDEIRKKYGPEAVALFNHGAGASWFKHLLSAYGTANFGAPSFAQCRGPRDVAFDLTFGAEPGSPEVLDIGSSDCLVLIGSHLGENMHNTQVQDFAEAVARGADIIVVDPRFSTAASKAKTWMPIRPGTDTALLLAWIHVIVGEQRYNRAYVEKYVSGLEELAKAVAPYSPEWASAETGLDATLIRGTARRIAGAAPASLVHPGRHATWYGPDDTHRSRAIAILNALLGSWGHRGGFFRPSGMKLAKFPTPPYPKARPPADRLEGEAPFALEPLAQGLRRATIDGKPYPIKGWFVYGTNLIQALPQRAETLKAIQALDLMVVVDVLPAEIAGYADVVLPEASYLERYDDLVGISWRRSGVALRQPAMPPPGEAKAGWWIARELGLRLGLESFFPWKDAESYLRERCKLSGVDWDTLVRDGVVLAPEKPTVVEDGLALSIGTESGKIEVYSEKLAKAGFAPVPVYERPDAAPPGYFRLLYGRAPGHTFGRTTNNRLLGELSHHDRVWINAKVAADLGLADGAWVRLINQDGVQSAPVQIRATERIRGDCVYMVHGWGHTAKGLRYAKGRGADDSELVSRVKVDPVMGGTGMRVNFVTLQPAAREA
ncbi:MAG: molybdopterin-dependent oxidoreductase [Deltaproteobacteria bacterium]|nr:molybdopterin-dependent oxidoreductase [Deltaproteobacteria bacterium]